MNTKSNGLNDATQSEIKQAFQVFDEERTGVISSNALKLLIRALGFRITRNEAIQFVQEYHSNNKETCEYMDKDSIDCKGVLDIVTPYYTQRDPVLQEKMNFRLFDSDHKGFITHNDLKNVVNDLNQHWEEMGLEHPIDLGDDQLKAMIDDFDGDLDGMISEKDFHKIMNGFY